VSVPDLSLLQTVDKRVIARALAAIETQAHSVELAALLDAACAAARAHVIGLTGPPGVGKSTLTNVLVARARARGETVGVLAVDPSSRRTGGALLGDRARIATDPADRGVFVRSMAARDRLGGLSDQTVAAMVLMRATTISCWSVRRHRRSATSRSSPIRWCCACNRAGDSLQSEGRRHRVPDVVASQGRHGRRGARAPTWKARSIPSSAAPGGSVAASRREARRSRRGARDHPHGCKTNALQTPRARELWVAGTRALRIAGLRPCALLPRFGGPSPASAKSNELNALRF
jgi:energy-coupling factor transporter ATP-binding protein EcfA2